MIDESVAIHLIRPPYNDLEPIEDLTQLPRTGVAEPGTALVWSLSGEGARIPPLQVRNRPRGMALILVLPPAALLGPEVPLLRIVERCRPQSILPFHVELEIEDMITVMRRTPRELSIEVMDYLTWRGLRVDLDTRSVIRKTLDLSSELTTISGLSRALYMSRRALGRRFMTRGLPVPSHWLHFGRVLRAALQLQNGADNLANVAYHFGYPDGFSLSNQMKRLTGARPSEAKLFLGWEWLTEAWIQQEMAAGTFQALARVDDRKHAREAAHHLALQTSVAHVGA